MTYWKPQPVLPNQAFCFANVTLLQRVRRLSQPPHWALNFPRTLLSHPEGPSTWDTNSCPSQATSTQGSYNPVLDRVLGWWAGEGFFSEKAGQLGSPLCQGDCTSWGGRGLVLAYSEGKASVQCRLELAGFPQKARAWSSELGGLVPTTARIGDSKVCVMAGASSKGSCLHSRVVRRQATESVWVREECTGEGSVSTVLLSSQKRQGNKYTNHLSKPLLHWSLASLRTTPRRMLTVVYNIPAPAGPPRLLC